MMSKLMTQKLVDLQQFSSSFDSSVYQSMTSDLADMRDTYLNRMQEILSVQLLDYASFQSKDPSILKYLF